MAYGEARGEHKAIVEAENWEGPSFEVCMNAGRVARAFETSRRREVLSFKHHHEVAALPADEADAPLDWCEEHLSSEGLFDCLAPPPYPNWCQ